MKRYFSVAVCLTIAITLLAFKTNLRTDNITEGNFSPYYFKFVGAHNWDEGNREAWALITQTEYNNPFSLPCGATNFGCKLIATDIAWINGEIRPRQIYLNIGSKNPITGQYVLEVSNFSN